MRSKEWQKAIDAAMDEESGLGLELGWEGPMSRTDVSDRKDQCSDTQDRRIGG